MAVTLRDDFTGSGSIAGRTPDGVNGGAWVNGPFGDAFTYSSIGGGVLSRSNYWEVFGTPSTPADNMYVEAHLLAPSFDLGARHTYPTGGGRGDCVGVFSEFVGSWKLFCYAIVGGSGPTGPITELAYPGGGVSIPDPWDFTVRVELLGDEIRVLLNGSEVGVGTQFDVPAGSGVILQSTGSGDLCDWIEAGTLEAPPPAAFVPFWTSFRNTHEVSETP